MRERRGDADDGAARSDVSGASVVFSDDPASTPLVHFSRLVAAAAASSSAPRKHSGLAALLKRNHGVVCCRRSWQCDGGEGGRPVEALRAPPPTHTHHTPSFQVLTTYQRNRRWRKKRQSVTDGQLRVERRLEGADASGLALSRVPAAPTPPSNRGKLLMLRQGCRVKDAAAENSVLEGVRLLPVDSSSPPSSSSSSTTRTWTTIATPLHGGYAPAHNAPCPTPSMLACYSSSLFPLQTSLFSFPTACCTTRCTASLISAAL